jgi:hypothetical protein
VLISIPIILSIFFSDSINNNIILIVILVITVPMLYLVIKRLYSMRNRHPERWHLRQWETGKLPAKQDQFPVSLAQQTVTTPPPSTQPPDDIMPEEIENTAEDQITTNVSGNTYKCQLVKTQAPDLTPLEDNINDLNKDIRNCNQKQKQWINNRNHLKRQLCDAKGISQKDCLKYKLEQIN